MLDRAVQADLQEALGPGLIVNGSKAFETERQVWNAMIDRRPAAIAPCWTADDVSRALTAAAASSLSVSVRGGGHNIAGTAVADGALMIDLSPMRAVEIDVQKRIAHVEGGARWSDFDGMAEAHGLAAPGGVVSSTGVAGLTLGGGFGWLARLHGLAADNLISAELVLASGEIMTVSADEHPDLFWAVRGGSGNFGIATRFTFRLHEIGPDVLFGPTFFALDEAERVLSAYAANAGCLPREACAWANLMTAPPSPVLPDAIHGEKVLTLMQFHADASNEARSDLETLYGGVQPLGDALAPRAYAEAQGFLDPAYDFGARNYWRSHNHLELTPGLITTLLDLAPDLPTPESELLICQLGGAIADVADGETAFPHRRIPFISTPGVRWRDPVDDERVIGWLKAASARIAEHAVPGSYVNFIAETDGTAERAYGANLARLAAIKQRYDPGNLFRSNQNIAPAAAAA